MIKGFSSESIAVFCFDHPTQIAKSNAHAPSKCFQAEVGAFSLPVAKVYSRWKCVGRPELWC